MNKRRKIDGQQLGIISSSYVVVTDAPEAKQSLIWNTINVNCLGLIVEYLMYKEIIVTLRVQRIWHSIHLYNNARHFRHCQIDPYQLMLSSRGSGRRKPFSLAQVSSPIGRSLSRYATHLSFRLLPALRPQRVKSRWFEWFSQYQFISLQSLSLRQVMPHLHTALLEAIASNCPHLVHLAVNLFVTDGADAMNRLLGRPLIPFSLCVKQLRTLQLKNVGYFELSTRRDGYQMSQLEILQWQWSTKYNPSDLHLAAIVTLFSSTWSFFHNLKILILNQLYYLTDVGLLDIFKQLPQLQHLSIKSSRKLTANVFEEIHKRRLANNLTSLDVAHLDAVSGGHYQLQMLASGFPMLRRLCLFSNEFLNDLVDCCKHLSQAGGKLYYLGIQQPTSYPLNLPSTSSGDVSIFQPLLQFPNLHTLILAYKSNWFDEELFHEAPVSSIAHMLRSDDLFVLSGLRKLETLSIEIKDAFVLDSPSVLGSMLKKFPKLHTFHEDYSLVWSNKNSGAYTRHCTARHIHPVLYEHAQDCDPFQTYSGLDVSCLKLACEQVGCRFP